jgi:polyisoprenyl-phosphate glycosyltransferase
MGSRQKVTVTNSPFHIAVVTPVFNDWPSLSILLDRISDIYRPEQIQFSIAIVDDGSTQPVPPLHAAVGGRSCIRRVEIIRLVTNLGHQRAIAVGLVQVSQWSTIDAVLVMDSDGEDRPEDIATLADAFRVNPDAAILAQRSKRSEGLIFRIGYLIYKLLFRLLTGQNISSGNFVLIPVSIINAITFSSALWNSLAATLIRAKYRLVNVPTVRGERYSGRSQMNFVSLVSHGLGSISVYVDIIFVRLLLVCMGIMASLVLAIIIVVCYKLFTNLATPGWTTTLISMFLIIMFQAGVFIVGSTLMLLGNRSNYLLVPALDSSRFIERRAERKFSDCQKTGG